MNWQDQIPEDIKNLYEIHNYHHAAEVLSMSYSQEFGEILEALRNFRITEADITAGGGNESVIPKKFSEALRPLGWYETKIQGDLLIRKIVSGNGAGRTVTEELRIDNFLDGHKVDYVKNQVAFDLEWNSKDQTFDRDLLAMRTYYDCDIVSVGIILTRSEELNDVFRTVFDYNDRTRKWEPILRKYGASTTWMGKLLPRLTSRRNGGCPILAIGIKKKCITDWTEEYVDVHSTSK